MNEDECEWNRMNKANEREWKKAELRFCEKGLFAVSGQTENFPWAET